MTLFIAFALMDHIGGYQTSSYFFVFVLWLLHASYHASSSK